MDVASEVPGYEENEIVQAIGRSRILAILRGDLRGKAVSIVETLIASGITAVEVTLNSPNPFETIQAIHRNVRSPFFLGAGTVLSQDQVTRAFECGARFVVSPNMAPAVIRTTKQLGMTSFPGCATCTEILEAFECGADAAKIFPAITIRPEGIRAILSSLGDLRLIPTGGVTRENAPHYLAAGAWALGVGSELVDARQLESMMELRIRAEEFAAVAAAGRGPL